MFGNVVMGIEKEVFEHLIHEVKKKKKVHLDIELTAEDLKGLVEKFKTSEADVVNQRANIGTLQAGLEKAKIGVRDAKIKLDRAQGMSDNGLGCRGSSANAWRWWKGTSANRGWAWSLKHW